MTRRIVQLTDCHLFADPQRALREIVTWPRFELALQHLEKKVPDAEWWVLTGDTAHDEARDTYESVRRHVERCTGKEWQRRVQVIPGNHDNRQWMRDVFGSPEDGPADRFTFQIRWPDWQVIGLDSQRPGELCGSLGDEQLDWLDHILSTHRQPTLLFLHHPPLTVQSPWLDKIGLQDADEFERRLRRHSHVRLVMAGHVHQEFAGELGHATVFTTPAVGPRFRPRTEQLEITRSPPAYRIIELHAGGRWTTQVLECDEKV